MAGWLHALGDVAGGEGGGDDGATNIQSPEHNLDDIVVRTVGQELRQLT
jgi:hypothetical protein